MKVPQKKGTDLPLFVGLWPIFCGYLKSGPGMHLWDGFFFAWSCQNPFLVSLAWHPRVLVFCGTCSPPSINRHLRERLWTNSLVGRIHMEIGTKRRESFFMGKIELGELSEKNPSKEPAFLSSIFHGQSKSHGFYNSFFRWGCSADAASYPHDCPLTSRGCWQIQQLAQEPSLRTERESEGEQ